MKTPKKMISGPNSNAGLIQGLFVFIRPIRLFLAILQDGIIRFALILSPDKDVTTRP